MNGKDRFRNARGVAFVNLQKRYVVRTAALSAFVRSLKRHLRLGKREFNICFVDDNAIRHLNFAYRGKDKATDILSFPWNDAVGAQPSAASAPSRRGEQAEFTNFLGDMVISVEAARRNAATEGHATLKEIRWLILHGLLHLLGYDHERDSGQMIALELALRERLNVAGRARYKQKSKGKTHKATAKAVVGST
jgi:probable rRNA maturation factor